MNWWLVVAAAGGSFFGSVSSEWLFMRALKRRNADLEHEMGRLQQRVDALEREVYGVGGKL